MIKQPLPYTITIDIQAPNANQERYLKIIGEVLAVDREIDEKNLQKTIQTKGQILSIRLKAKQLKLIRSCATGIMRHLRLVAETIKELGDIQ